MNTADNAEAQLTEAINILKDAIRKKAFDNKAFQADIAKAVVILNGLSGIQAVGPDPESGN